jgi:hypothetical protein
MILSLKCRQNLTQVYLKAISKWGPTTGTLTLWQSHFSFEYFCLSTLLWVGIFCLPRDIYLVCFISFYQYLSKKKNVYAKKKKKQPETFWQQAELYEIMFWLGAPFNATDCKSISVLLGICFEIFWIFSFSALEKVYSFNLSIGIGSKRKFYISLLPLYICANKYLFNINLLPTIFHWQL